MDVNRLYTKAFISVAKVKALLFVLGIRSGADIYVSDLYLKHMPNIN